MEDPLTPEEMEERMVQSERILKQRRADRTARDIRINREIIARKTFNCNVCDQAFRSALSLKDHENSLIHKRLVEEGKSDYACKCCNISWGPQAEAPLDHTHIDGDMHLLVEVFTIRGEMSEGYTPFC